MTRGALGGGSLGLALFLITTVVSPIASAVNWWDLSSSPVAWGGSAACSVGAYGVALCFQLIWVQMMCWLELNSFLGNLRLSAQPFLCEWQLWHSDGIYCFYWKSCRNRNTSCSLEAVLCMEVMHHSQPKRSPSETPLTNLCCGWGLLPFLKGWIAHLWKTDPLIVQGQQNCLDDDWMMCWRKNLMSLV